MGICVAKQANLLKQFWTQQMRFIDEEYRCAATALYIKQHFMKRRQAFGLACGGAFHLEFVQHHFQKLFAS